MFIKSDTIRAELNELGLYLVKLKKLCYLKPMNLISTGNHYSKTNLGAVNPTCRIKSCMRLYVYYILFITINIVSEYYIVIRY